MSKETITADPKDYGWVLLEIMGHRQRIGKAREEAVAGGVMLRIDVLTPSDGGDDLFVTEYYGTGSIYALRPVAEEVARNAAVYQDPRPPAPAGYQPASRIEDRSGDPDFDEVDEDKPF